MHVVFTKALIRSVPHLLYAFVTHKKQIVFTKTSQRIFRMPREKMRHVELPVSAHAGNVAGAATTARDTPKPNPPVIIHTTKFMHFSLFFCCCCFWFLFVVVPYRFTFYLNYFIYETFRNTFAYGLRFI